MFNWLNLFDRKICNIISPPFCEFCKIHLQDRTIFCENCFLNIKPILPIRLSITTNYPMYVYAISAYQEPLKSLILAKKWSNHLASKHLGNLIWDMTEIKNLDFDYLVPVPLHWTRKIKRGYNQTEVMAQLISRKSNKQVLNILNRTKRTKYQLELNKQERIRNVIDSFTLKKVNHSNFNNSHIILVDDLFTSGSTIFAAAKELVKLKPRKISAVVACRVI